MAQNLSNRTTHDIHTFTNSLMIFFEWRYFEGNKIDIHMILHYIDRFPHFVRKPEIQFYAHDVSLLS